MTMTRRTFGLLSVIGLLFWAKPKLKKGEINWIKLSDLTVGHSKLDDELVKSIAKDGMINPICVTKKYEIIDGFSRVRAAKELNLTKVPALCIEPSINLINLTRRS